MIYLRWVGIFVAAVGLSYAWTRRGGERAETVWAFTALVRILVAAFLAVGICQGALAPLWASVAATDALVALVQILGLRAGWWKGGHG